MVLFLRRRRSASRAKKDNNGNAVEINRDSDSDQMTEIVIPTHFMCPISLDLMKDPVTLSTGITYDRDNIERWIESGNRSCPVTNQVLSSFDQIPNHAIRRMIQDWCVRNQSHGIERIPTPRIPATPVEVASACERIAAAAKRNDVKKCRELVGKIKEWAKDSERNRKCIRKSLVGRVLSMSFEAFCVASAGREEDENSAAVRSLLEMILSVLTWVLDEEGRAVLGKNNASLRRLVSFLCGNDLSARQNAVLVIGQLLSSGLESDRGTNYVAESLAGIEGSVEGLVRMIREPVCPRATKASLTAIFHMIDSTSSRFVELGVVSLLLESVVEGERGVCERALRVLDAICNSKNGREKARENALTIPLVVKKILRLSDSATELSVSVLWKLLTMEIANTTNKADDDLLVIEALQVGAFQKLLMLLQIGCSERMKEKVTELLKLFNLHRRRLECDDSSDDFKYLKKSF